MGQTGSAVRLYGPNSLPLDVLDGVAVPAGTAALIPAVVDPTGSIARYIRGDAAGRQDMLLGSWFGSTAPTVGQKPMAASIPVTMASDQSPISVAVGLAPGVLALPKLVNLIYDQSDGAILANAWKRVLTYTVPAGFNAYLLRYSSFQAEAAASRIVVPISMATLSIVTNAFVAGTSYISPQFTTTLELVVTTALSSGSGSVVVTVGYTNHEGVAGRTGTFTITKGAAVGARAEFVFQAGDIGMQSIQSAVTAPTLAAGAVTLEGLLQLTAHQDQSTTQQSQTLYAPGSVSFPTGTVLAMGYNGGTVSKLRTLSALVQLVAV